MSLRMIVESGRHKHLYISALLRHEKSFVNSGNYRERVTLQYAISEKCTFLIILKKTFQKDSRY